MVRMDLTLEGFKFWNLYFTDSYQDRVHFFESCKKRVLSFKDSPMYSQKVNHWLNTIESHKEDFVKNSKLSDVFDCMIYMVPHPVVPLLDSRFLEINYEI